MTRVSQELPVLLWCSCSGRHLVSGDNLVVDKAQSLVVEYHHIIFEYTPGSQNITK